jgi:hypothetical protein
VRVHRKGGTERTVFLSADARAALADYLEHEGSGDADERSGPMLVAGPYRQPAATWPLVTRVLSPGGR